MKTVGKIMFVAYFYSVNVHFGPPYTHSGAARTIIALGGGGEYSYMCVLLNQLLLKSIVFTVCEHKCMNICPLNYRSAGASAYTTDKDVL